MTSRFAMKRAWIVMLALALCSGSAMGVVEGLTDISEFSSGGTWDGMNWDYVGSRGVGSAVAVGRKHFITNRHFSSTVGQVVSMNGVDYTIEEVINAPDHAGNTPDLRMLKVSDPLPGYYELYDGAFTGGGPKNLIMVGTGYSGTIDTVNSDYLWLGGTGREKRWGTNRFESFTNVTSGSYTSFTMQMNFDYGETAYEAGLGSGDSGSGIFFKDGGVWKLAGMGAYVHALDGTSPPYDVNWALSMLLYADWIRETIVIPGDFNDDGNIDDGDIDTLCDNMGDAAFDLDGDSDSDEDDLVFLVENLVELQDGSGRVGTKRGDFNLDGYVNATDLALMQPSFGLTGIGWAGGNANCDDVVNATDLALLAENIGFAAPTGAVPEPVALALLGIGGVALLRRRSR